MESLKKQTANGVKWLAGASFVQKGISFGTTIILARILNPSVFGLYALAFVAIDAMGLFKSMGFDSALIRKKGDTEKAANTAFFIIPLLGVILYLILSMSAPMIGEFFKNQEIVSVIKALGIIFIISCFGKVPAAILEKNMQFKKVTIMEVSSTLVYAASAITFAILKFGVWSLVIAYILKTLNQNILAWILSKWRPCFEFDKKVALEMFHFGKFIFLGAVVWFLKMNLDNLLVGKLLGVVALGLYAIAFNIANFIADYFGTKVNRVVFPAYSKLQGDISDLRRASLETLKLISIIALPLGVLLFFFGDGFVSLVYGPKWAGATGVLKILVFAGVFNTLPVGLNAVFLACGKPKLAFWITSLQVSLFFIFITPMARALGINGVGMVVSISSFISFIITLSCAMKILSIKLGQIYTSLKPSLLSSFFMVSGLILLKKFVIQYKIDSFTNNNFIIFFILSIVIYIYSLYKIEKQILKEIKNLVF